MWGLREGLIQAQWRRLNWLGMETAGNFKKGSHNEVFNTKTTSALETVFETFFIKWK